MNFKLRFRIISKETGESIYFKPDGQRFGHTQTVKIKANTKYLLLFTFRPALQLRKLRVNGELHKFEKKSELVLVEDEDSATTYTSNYSTVGENVHKKGKRKEVHFSLEFMDGVHMSFHFQCKLYDFKDKKHAKWGQKLSAIELGCQSVQGQNFITVLKETYL